MNYEDMPLLLEPGYLPLETGYTILPSGELFVAVCNQLHGCKAEMLDWWFGHFETVEDFQEWHPDDHLWHIWNDKWRPGYYIGAAHTARQKIAGKEPQYSTIHFEDPLTMFDEKHLADSRATVVLAYSTAGEYGDSEEKAGRFVHCARDTKFGCELRSRFWLTTNSEDFGPLLIDHCFNEYSNCAEIWPRIFADRI